MKESKKEAQKLQKTKEQSLIRMLRHDKETKLLSRKKKSIERSVEKSVRDPSFTIV